MRFLVIIGAVLWLALPAAAQTADEDRGFLTRLIEDSLSGAGRDVTITGFAGALSSEATIAQMTIADSEGVWLTLRDVVLTWNRSALFRKAIDVRQLRAAEIIVARPPVTEASGPSPEAQPFALPELPVSVSLGALQIDRISLGPDFLGAPVDFSLTGSASLAGGEGAANIEATRLGDKTGIFAFEGAYANATRALAVLLRIEEGPGGIAAGLIGLPGQPSVRLEVAGDAPLDDFAATLSLATAGQERLRGDFALAAAGDGQRATVDLRGDVSPLFAPAYRGFFGDDAVLQAEVITGPQGAVDVPRLALDAGRLTLDGRLRLGAGGWPELIDIAGGITAVGGQPVLLPLSGPETFVDGLDLDITYDVAVADDWRADIRLDGLTRPGLAIDGAQITGGGLIRPAAAGGEPGFTARLNYAATGLRLDDAGAQAALGDVIGGVLVAARDGGGVTEVSALTLEGAGVQLDAAATIAGPKAGFATDATIRAGIDGLARFSTLADRPLAGGAAVDIAVQTTPLEGTFDLRLDGQTRDLAIGIAEADRLLTGQGDIALRLVRDTAGTRVETFALRTDAASVQGRADLTSAGTTAELSAEVADLALILPALSGPATVTGALAQDAEGVIRFDVAGRLPETDFAAKGQIAEDAAGRVIDAEMTADAADLGRFDALAGMPLSGAARLQAEGRLQTDGMVFDVTLDGQSTDLAIGQPRVDPFLAGAGQVSGRLSRSGDKSFTAENLTVRTPAAQLRADGMLDLTGSSAGEVAFVINDAGMLDPALSGPLRAEITATPLAGAATRAVVAVAGPGTAVQADVTIAPPAEGREITGAVDAEIARLAAFAGLAGRPIAGSIDLTATGTVLPDLSRFEAQVDLRSEDLKTGLPTLDPLLAGTGRINAAVGLQDGVLGVRTLEVSTREVSIVAALNGARGFGQGRFNASLRDVGVLTDQISGPVRATGQASLDAAGNWGIDATGTGPGGLAAKIVGQLAPDGTLAVDVDGSAPLALANAALDPRRLSGQANFDLAVNGPPALSSVSGRVTVEGGRFAAPNLRQTLTDISGGFGLAAGRLDIDLRSNVEAGGTVRVTGPVVLSGGFDADLNIDLSRVVLRDPDLYRTEVDGQVAVNGPLLGGARIAGTLGLGQTDVRVPSAAISSLGALPDVTHVGASEEVRRTLQRAGLLQETAGDNAAAGGRPFPLDLTINAPSRIFVRGRGLDAELGGSLQIGGTTENVIPVGQFSLIRGRIDILQQRFALTEGSATLQGDFEPFLRLVATTEASTGTVIRIIVEGPAGSPDVTFASVPELPQDEVLAQLIFGRNLENISALQAVQLAAAINTLAGGGSGALDGVRANLGLDDFDVTTDDQGNAAVRAGAYLSDNVYTDVTVTSQGNTEINLNLDITDALTAKGGVDQEGETRLGVFFERDY